MDKFFNDSIDGERWLKIYQLIITVNVELKDIFPNILSHFGDCECGSDNINGTTIWETDSAGESYGSGALWWCDNCDRILHEG